VPVPERERLPASEQRADRLRARLAEMEIVRLERRLSLREQITDSALAGVLDVAIPALMDVAERSRDARARARASETLARLTDRLEPERLRLLRAQVKLTEARTAQALAGDGAPGGVAIHITLIRLTGRAPAELMPVEVAPAIKRAPELPVAGGNGNGHRLPPGVDLERPPS
jgi:hypothetical protein